jgi:peptide/nickel transport system substrate-binding protein
MTIGLRGCAALAAVLALCVAAKADEAPKHGGMLTYMIPADAPPSFDAQREETYATIHSAAPFYSTLIRANPTDPASPDMVCDLCTEMPQPTDNGTTYTFKIRSGVKFHDGTPLTADDVAASWSKIIFPPAGVVSPRQSNFLMVDKVEATDPTTVVFHLKFATDAFIPALADPYAWIYSKAKLNQDIHWYEKNIDGSGPFKFVSYETGQSIEGVRNPDYYHAGLPYLDGFKGIFADKQVIRVDALRSDRAAIEFRGFPPTVRDELKGALGDEIAVQESDWNCGGLITPNHQRKPFDDPRVRRALTLALDRWHTAPQLAKVALVRTVGGVTFPGSPLAPSKEELQQIAGYWPDIEKSRAEAKRLLKEAGAENLSFELLNRSTDQPYKYYGIWAVDDWSKIGLKVTQKVLPVGPWFAAQRAGDFDVTVEGNCQNVVNPLADVGKYLPHTISASNYGNFEDDREIETKGNASPVREIRTGRTGARHLPAVVAADRAVPFLRQGLEDWPEPLRKSGSVDGLARQVRPSAAPPYPRNQASSACA